MTAQLGPQHGSGQRRAAHGRRICRGTRHRYRRCRQTARFCGSGFDPSRRGLADRGPTITRRGPKAAAGCARRHTRATGFLQQSPPAPSIGNASWPSSWASEGAISRKARAGRPRPDRKRRKGGRPASPGIPLTSSGPALLREWANQAFIDGPESRKWPSIRSVESEEQCRGVSRFAATDLPPLTNASVGSTWPHREMIKPDLAFS
jgi:hypothetical protein